MAKNRSDRLAAADGFRKTTHGEAIIYTPIEGDPVEAEGVLSSISTEHEDESDGRYEIKRTSVSILRDVDEGGIEEPEVGAMVTVAGLVWEVTAISGQDDSRSTLDLVWFKGKSKQHESHERRIK